MNAVERLEAAVTKLEGLRRERGYVEENGWLAEPNLEDRSVGFLEKPKPLVPITDDEIFVTLHRTIDAQLAILRDARERIDHHAGVMVRAQGGIDLAPGPYYCDPDGATEAAAYHHSHALALADAILGG